MNSVRGAWLPPSVRRDANNPAGIHMRMHNPPRPGEYLLEDALPAQGLAAVSLAKRIGGPPRSLSAVMLCHAPVSHELDAQLEFASLGSQLLAGPTSRI